MNQVKARELAEWEKGWLAGIIDGEGTVRLYIDKHKYYYKEGYYPRFRVELRVSNSFLPLVQKVTDVVGAGSITQLHNKRMGSKTVYSWHLSAHRDIHHVLKQILPYLIRQKENAESVLKYTERKPWQPHTRESFEEALRLVSNVNSFNKMFGKKSNEGKPLLELIPNKWKVEEKKGESKI